MRSRHEVFLRLMVSLGAREAVQISDTLSWVTLRRTPGEFRGDPSSAKVKPEREDRE